MPLQGRNPQAPQAPARGVVVGRFCIVLLALLFVPAAVAHVGPPDAPPEAFCIVVIEPLDGFRLLRVTVDEDLKAAAKQADWQAANVNGDGTLSPQEQEGFRAGSLRFWPGGLDMGNHSVYLQPGAPYTTFTAVRPVYATTWRHVGHGYYEDRVSSHSGVEQGAPVDFGQFETQAVREYGYHVSSPLSRMTLHGGANMTANLTTDTVRHEEGRPVIETVIVKAPEHWIITHIQGLGYNGTFDRIVNDASVQIRGFDTSSPWTIDFLDPNADEEMGKVQGGPGFEVAFLLIGIVPLVWLLRRRET